MCRHELVRIAGKPRWSETGVPDLSRNRQTGTAAAARVLCGRVTPGGMELAKLETFSTETVGFVRAHTTDGDYRVSEAD